MHDQSKLHRIVIGTLSALVLVLSVARGAIHQAPEKQLLVEKVTQSPSAHTRVENPDGTPIMILDSRSKEISNTDYKALVGLTAIADKLASFPDVKLFNNADKRIIAFTLLLKNEKTNTRHFLRVSGPTLQPQSEYFVSAVRWIRRDSQPQRQMDWSSEKAWLLSSANDLVVRVGFVKFEDGTQWIIKDADAGSTSSNVQISRARFSNSRNLYALAKVSTRYSPDSCVCECGAICWGKGVCDCNGSCGSCMRYEDCINCGNNCCSAACGAECDLM